MPIGVKYFELHNRPKLFDPIGRELVKNRRSPRMAAQLRASESSAAPAPSEKADMSMEAYQQMIREKISQMSLSSTRQMEAVSIQISDAAFERMKNDPDYEAWVLNDLREAFSQSNPWVD